MRYQRREKRQLAESEEAEMRTAFDKSHWVRKIDDRVELSELL